MSDFVSQNNTISRHLSGTNGWVVLSSVEAQLKEKIEKVGIPLKKWDVQINYGIKTGLNEAFIINQETKESIERKSPKSAEIIRPILRGKDIQKYGADWNELYIIGTFPSLNLNIDDFPAVKKHLLSFGIERLEQTGMKYKINGESIGSRKKTGNTWFETQDQINYWQDFNKPKIIYPEITKFINFFLDNETNYYVNNKCFILTGERIEFLVAFLNSSLFKYCFLNNFPELLGGTRELRKVFFERIPVIKITEEENNTFKSLVDKIQKIKRNKMPTSHIERELDTKIFDLYNLTAEERATVGFIEIN